MHSSIASVAFVLSLGACATAVDDSIIDGVPDDVIAQQSTVQSLGCTNLVADGVDSVRGLVGNYYRFGASASDELVALNVRTLIEHSDTIGVTGSWDGFVKRGALVRFERGTYLALPDNAATGALIALQSPARDDEYYFIVGVQRNYRERISALCIVKSPPEGSTASDMTPFLLQRTGL